MHVCSLFWNELLERTQLKSRRIRVALESLQKDQMQLIIILLPVDQNFQFLMKNIAEVEKEIRESETKIRESETKIRESETEIQEIKAKVIDYETKQSTEKDVSAIKFYRKYLVGLIQKEVTLRNETTTLRRKEAALQKKSQKGKKNPISQLFLTIP
jgi:predicted  nucleic acid-binding Zn-ribbon protein